MNNNNVSCRFKFRLDYEIFKPDPLRGRGLSTASSNAREKATLEHDKQLALFVDAGYCDQNGVVVEQGPHWHHKPSKEVSGSLVKQVLCLELWNGEPLGQFLNRFQDQIAGVYIVGSSLPYFLGMEGLKEIYASHLPNIPWEQVSGGIHGLPFRRTEEQPIPHDVDIRIIVSNGVDHIGFAHQLENALGGERSEFDDAAEDGRVPDYLEKQTVDFESDEIRYSIVSAKLDAKGGIGLCEFLVFPATEGKRGDILGVTLRYNALFSTQSLYAKLTIGDGEQLGIQYLSVTLFSLRQYLIDMVLGKATCLYGQHPWPVGVRPRHVDAQGRMQPDTKYMQDVFLRSIVEGVRLSRAHYPWLCDMARSMESYDLIKFARKKCAQVSYLVNEHGRSNERVDSWYSNTLVLFLWRYSQALARLGGELQENSFAWLYQQCVHPHSLTITHPILAWLSESLCSSVLSVRQIEGMMSLLAWLSSPGSLVRDGTELVWSLREPMDCSIPCRPLEDLQIVLACLENSEQLGRFLTLLQAWFKRLGNKTVAPSGEWNQRILVELGELHAFQKCAELAGQKTGIAAELGSLLLLPFLTEHQKKRFLLLPREFTYIVEQGLACVRSHFKMHAPDYDSLLEAWSPEQGLEGWISNILTRGTPEWIEWCWNDQSARALMLDRIELLAGDRNCLMRVLKKLPKSAYENFAFSDRYAKLFHNDPALGWRVMAEVVPGIPSIEQAHSLEIRGLSRHVVDLCAHLYLQYALKERLKVLPQGVEELLQKNAVDSAEGVFSHLSREYFPKWVQHLLYHWVCESLQQVEVPVFHQFPDGMIRWIEKCQQFIRQRLGTHGDPAFLERFEQYCNPPISEQERAQQLLISLPRECSFEDVQLLAKYHRDDERFLSHITPLLIALLTQGLDVQKVLDVFTVFPKISAQAWTGLWKAVATRGITQNSVQRLWNVCVDQMSHAPGWPDAIECAHEVWVALGPDSLQMDPLSWGGVKTQSGCFGSTFPIFKSSVQNGISS